MAESSLAGLEAARFAWVAAVGRGDAEEYADLVTPDVVWVRPNGEAVIGRAAFRAWLERFFDEFTYELGLHPEHVAGRGDWAVERGRFASTVVARAGESGGTHEGAYCAVWQRCDDGRWRIDRYLDTTDRAG